MITTANEPTNKQTNKQSIDALSSTLFRMNEMLSNVMKTKYSFNTLLLVEFTCNITNISKKLVLFQDKDKKTIIQQFFLCLPINIFMLHILFQQIYKYISLSKCMNKCYCYHIFVIISYVLCIQYHK